VSSVRCGLWAYPEGWGDWVKSGEVWQIGRSDTKVTIVGCKLSMVREVLGLAFTASRGARWCCCREMQARGLCESQPLRDNKPGGVVEVWGSAPSVAGEALDRKSTGQAKRQKESSPSTYISAKSAATQVAKGEGHQ
jgi:hypothetical protein